MGALKAWIYAPVFRFFGVSALTIRLPAILLAAVTLLIFFQTLRAKLGAVWATIAVWIMAVDPVNLFPSRLGWGRPPTDSRRPIYRDRPISRRYPTLSWGTRAPAFPSARKITYLSVAL